MRVRLFVIALASIFVACSGGSSDGGDGETSGNGSSTGGSDTNDATGGTGSAGSDSTGSGETGSTGQGPGSGTASGTGGDIGPCMPTGMACPNYTVTGEEVTCDLDNTASTDLVQDTRLEFGEGPDDAILYTVPSDGEYGIWLESEPSSNGGCGVSVHDADMQLHTTAECPGAGMTVDLDGYYSVMDFPISLTAGTEVVLFVGCTYWADAQSGPYRLRIAKL